MNFEEFLTPEQRGSNTEAAEDKGSTPVINQTEEESVDNDIDVQKAVVESLAADKAVQEEHINSLRKTIVELRSRLAMLENQLRLKTEELDKVGELLSRNTEEEKFSNKISLLDRSEEMPDRFAGESRDQILETLREAREAAERDGRVRRAQIIESVLLANEPEGTLARLRQELINIFNANGNIVSGPVIEELEKRGISHKNGEEYLLPSEIIKRAY